MRNGKSASSWEVRLGYETSLGRQKYQKLRLPEANNVQLYERYRMPKQRSSARLPLGSEPWEEARARELTEWEEARIRELSRRCSQVPGLLKEGKLLADVCPVKCARCFNEQKDIIYRCALAAQANAPTITAIVANGLVCHRTSIVQVSNVEYDEGHAAVLAEVVQSENQGGS
jgi:hypothetical protein